MKKTLLVTGASGQLGQTLQEIAKTHPHYRWIFCTKAELDISDPVMLKAVFSTHQPDFCINAAAYTNVRKAEEEEALANQINAEGVASLVNQCNQQGVILFHISTDYVFDGEQSTPYTEQDQPNPLNMYGKSKWAGEKAVLQHSHHGYVIRTSWLYSKNHGHNFYRSIVKKAQVGEDLQVVDDQIGTPTSTDELASFLLQLVQQLPKQGVYHCGGKKIQSWFEFAKDILKEHQLSASISPIKTPKEALRRPFYSALGTEKKGKE